MNREEMNDLLAQKKLHGDYNIYTVPDNKHKTADPELVLYDIIAVQKANIVRNRIISITGKLDQIKPLTVNRLVPKVSIVDGTLVITGSHTAIMETIKEVF